MDERLAKAAAAIRASGADWGIFTSPDGVAYASGHVVSIEAGPSPFAGGPAVAFVSADGVCGLVVTNLEAGTASWATEIVTYDGFSFREPTDIFANYRQAASGLAVRLGVGGTVAVEEQSFPLSLHPLIAHMPHLVSIEPAFKRERAIKTTTEIGLLREAALVASAGQRAFLQTTAAGMTELEAFSHIRLAMEARTGERLPLTGDFISGRDRTSTFMGWPGNRMIERGDPLICDLAPRVAGYWGDSCASAMSGSPTPDFLRLFEAVKSALTLAVETVRPGLAIGTLDSTLQAHIGRHRYSYAHHSGHSIGTGVHEWPRLVAYETETLKQDMVIMVEPTALDPEIGGVRLEWMLHVTADGCEVLSDFKHMPEIG